MKEKVDDVTSSVGVGGTENVYDRQWSCAEETPETDAESAGRYSTTVSLSICLFCSFLLFISFQSTGDDNF